MLTELQERTWRILAAVPEADGFALAGGSALILTGVVQRGSNDIDVFGAYPRSAIPFAEAAQRVLTDEGLNPTVERWGEGFVRMRVTDGADTTRVDIAIDARRHPTVADPTGQVLNIRELAADKMLALVGRVAPRDYIDMWAITQRHHIDDVIDWASDKVNPPGFSGDSNWLGDNGVWEDQQCIHRRFGSGLWGWFRSIGWSIRVGWAAICSIAEKFGCSSETLRKWVRRAETDQGVRAGLTSEEQTELKQLRRENRELRRANEILRKASAYFALAELDRGGRR